MRQPPDIERLATQFGRRNARQQGVPDLLRLEGAGNEMQIQGLPWRVDGEPPLRTQLHEGDRKPCKEAAADGEAGDWD